MELNPDAMSWRSVYKLMIGSIVPRPIGWISSVDAQGRHNLAPFSFFNGICANPPHVLFCPMIRGSDGRRKDTLNNVRQNREFVVNIVTEALAEAMNLTSAEFPPEVNEFEAAGLTSVPSLRVRPMRVAESPIHFECAEARIIDIGDQPGSGSLVIGRVLHIQVADEVLISPDRIDISRLEPIGRLAGNAYTRVRDRFDLVRPILPVPGDK